MQVDFVLNHYIILKYQVIRVIYRQENPGHTYIAGTFKVFVMYILSSSAEDAQQHNKQVDEIKVKG